ncbi:hypothetical protein MANES_11G023400v8 [Manihot esculenta]|uniref:Uncharacterized protein n=1 Tax=Manihot esculenta TaxID=3983 RepID=A0ACB7GTI6_MANES|nr:hypothetical protein MANES_11G023400v8 [Manihot esculenta]
MKGADEEHQGITAVAIDADKNSQSAVKWAVENLVHGNNPYCVFIHVQCKTTRHGEHLGNLTREGRAPNQQELQQLFLHYRGFCARRGIETKEVVIHDSDVPNALIDYIVHNKIRNIVLGAAQRNALMRKFKNADVPSTLLKIAPESCAVYVIAKGKVQTFRLARRPLHAPTISTHSTGSAHLAGSAHSAASAHSATSAHSAGSTYSTSLILSPLRHHSPSPPFTPSSNASSTSTSRQENHWDVPIESMHPKLSSQVSFCDSWKSDGSRKAFLNQNSYKDKYTFRFNGNSLVASPSIRSPESLLNRDFMSNSEFSGPESFVSANTSFDNFEYSASENSKSSNSSQLAILDAEMARLKLELQQSMELFNSVTKEAVLAKNMVRELHRLQTLDRQDVDEEPINEGAELSLIEMDKQKTVAKEAVQKAKRIAAELVAEKKVHHEAEERKKTLESMENNDFSCRRYTIHDIEIATNHFSASHKIGEGGYGPVFKGVLNHINVAIKVLRPDLSQGQKQFRQEVEVLSNMRHPNMVILLGACPEYGCLVYEFMENGSLEDRLCRKDNTPPIPWRTRFKIAFEIATALLFLHETKPEPLVHRDLKPGNILLDPNLVSKIADVGLARLLPPSVANDVTQYRMTAAAGTFYYIDPEYQQTGMLSVKSDLFSFGVVLLQLLTARPPMGLCYQIQDAIDNGNFPDMLDKSVRDWPVKEALSLAKLAVQCCELRKRDRPELATVVWPELKRLRDFALFSEVERETVIPLYGPNDLISPTRSHRNISGQ